MLESTLLALQSWIAGFGDALSGFWLTLQTTDPWFIVSALGVTYLVMVNAVYFLLSIASLMFIRRYVANHGYQREAIPPMYLSFAPPISVIVPVFNEATTVVTTVKSLLGLVYPEFEIILVNDGSTDGTLRTVLEAFDAKIFPEAYRQDLQTAQVKTMYMSQSHPNLRVVDKLNGGKADALNAGINASRYPLICCVDGDCYLQPDSLLKVAYPFMEDDTTVAAGGVVRIANGCHIDKGEFKPGLPDNIWALYQVVEYLRAFLFGRIGWSWLNSLLIISGAFGLFKKSCVIDVGGFRTNTVGEDMELVLRLHRFLTLNQVPYRITFVPDPICWTEVPEDLATLRQQRIRWQVGLAQSLLMNWDLCFHPKAGMVGWVAFPFMLICELLSPLIELWSFVVILLGSYLGFISPYVLIAMLTGVLGVSILLSMVTLLLEEMSYHLYAKPSDMFKLFFAVATEHLGYRQITLIWRFIGLCQFLLGGKSAWGTMQRKGLTVASQN